MIHTFELQKQIAPEIVKSIMKRYSFHFSGTEKGMAFFETTELWDKGIKKLTIMKMPLKNNKKVYQFFIKIQIKKK